MIAISIKIATFIFTALASWLVADMIITLVKQYLLTKEKQRLEAILEKEEEKRARQERIARRWK